MTMLNLWLCLFTTVIWVRSNDHGHSCLKYLLLPLFLNQVIREHVSGYVQLGVESNMSIEEDTLLSDYFDSHGSLELTTSRDFIGKTKLHTNASDDIVNQDIMDMNMENVTYFNGDKIEEIITEPDMHDETMIKASLGVENSKSHLYTSILASFPAVYDKYKLQIRSCKNRCGTSLYCSCKPTCQYFKTCCVDFLEACHNVYDFTQSKMDFQWLESVETQCISGNLVVTTCSKSSNVHNEYGNLFDSINNNLSLLNNGSGLSTNNRLTFFDVLSLLSTYNEKELYEQDLAQMLSRAPMLDTSTGISYKNISVYTCNEANLSHAILWNIYYPIINLTGNHTEPASKLQTFHNISNYIDSRLVRTNQWNPLYVDSTLVKDTNEFCNTQALDYCPEGFMDSDVYEACRNINFIMTTTLQNSSKIIFKNPFCFYCNMLGNDEIRSTRLLSPEILMEIGPFGYLIFKFGHFTREIDLVIKLYHIYDIRYLFPSWRGLACVFYSRRPLYYNGMTSTSIHKVIGSRCRKYQCYHILTSDDKCIQRFWYQLVFPPARYQLGEEFLEFLLQSWKRLLLDRVPVVYNETSHIEEDFYVYQKPLEKNGMYYQYALYVSIYSEVSGIGRLKQIIQEAVKGAMTRIDYPFQTNHKYVCATVNKFKLPYDRIASSCFNPENIVHLPDVKVENSSVRRYNFKFQNYTLLTFLVWMCILCYHV